MTSAELAFQESIDAIQVADDDVAATACRLLSFGGYTIFAKIV